jgi:hypothetical protein
VCSIEGCSSASQSLKLARYISLKSKFKSIFVLDSYRIALLRHYVVRRKLVVPKERWPAWWFGRLGGLAGSVVEYIVSFRCTYY